MMLEDIPDEKIVASYFSIISENTNLIKKLNEKT